MGFTVTATAGSGGSISPSGEVTVPHGGSQSFTITPDPGYQVLNVLVDNVSIGAVDEYAFTNVSSDHTIYAVFELLPDCPLNVAHEVECIIAGDVVRFAASSINADPICTIASWHWDFGDGTSSEDQSPEHVYAHPGEYAVTLTVTRITDLSDSKELSVRVYLRGDLNGDDKLDLVDVLMLYRCVADLLSLDGCQLLRADMNQDANVDMNDAEALRSVVFEKKWHEIGP
jgi:hypothetical protein